MFEGGADRMTGISDGPIPALCFEAITDKRMPQKIIGPRFDHANISHPSRPVERWQALVPVGAVLVELSGVIEPEAQGRGDFDVADVPELGLCAVQLYHVAFHVIPSDRSQNPSQPTIQIWGRATCHPSDALRTSRTVLGRLQAP